MRDLLYRTLVALRAVPPPPQPLTWESFFGPSQTLLAGVSIDESNALNYSPIWCGVSMLSRDVAKLPLMFYRNLKNGGKEPFKEHRLYRILHDEPNPEMSSFKFRETMQALCLLYGNAYAEIVRDDLGRPAGMYPIVPTRVQPMRNDAGRLFYRVTNYRGGQTDVAPANMLHLSSLSTDGILGRGIVAQARESIGLGVATERFGAAFFGNGSTFGGVVEVPGTLKDDGARDNVRKMIEAVHAGVDRAHKILVLAGGSKFTERGTKPNEAQYIETRKFQITETARWLTMPPHKLGDLENAHFTNIEEENIDYHVGTVSGWLQMWEQELTRKLVSPLEYAQQTIEHNTEGILRGDSTKRADFYSKMYAIGAFTINDILRKENMNPIGPEGDVHLVPLNMIPADRYNEWIDVTIAAKKAPPALPPADPAPDPEADPEADAARMQALVDEIRAATARSEEHVARAVVAESLAATRADHVAAHQATAEREQAAAAVSAAEARAAQLALAEAQTVIEQARQAQAEEVRKREAAEHLVAAAEAARLEAAALAETRAAQMAEAETRVSHASAEVARVSSEAESRASALVELATANQQLEERAAALTQAEQTALEAEASATATRAQLAALDAQLAEQKAAERDRLTRVVAAHRALIVEVVTRMLRPEVDRARRRQGTPDSLRKWAQAFYQTHRDVCADALYPVVLTHLAWKRSDDDARIVARSLADAHCALSERQLETVLTGAEPEEFHAALEQQLQRWEQDRPTALADTILADEIRYIGSLS